MDKDTAIAQIREKAGHWASIQITEQDKALVELVASKASARMLGNEILDVLRQLDANKQPADKPEFYAEWHEALSANNRRSAIASWLIAEERHKGELAVRYWRDDVLPEVKAERDRYFLAGGSENSIRMHREEELDAAKRVLDEARRLLMSLVDDEECRYDHHGACQTHFIETDCSVAKARLFLARVGVDGE